MSDAITEERIETILLHITDHARESLCAPDANVTKIELSVQVTFPKEPGNVETHMWTITP